MAKCQEGCTCGRHRGRSSTNPRALYDAQHHRVYKRRGPAKLQLCVKCGTQARDWAQIHDTDGSDVEHYQPMCRKCHREYDGWAEMISEAQRRRWAKLTPEQRTAYFAEHQEEISAGLRRMWAERTPEQKAEIAAKVAESQRGKYVSDETRARISASKKAMYAARREASD